MKRIIAAAILLVFVIITYTTGYFYITKACNQANVLLKECNADYNEKTDATVSTKKLEDFWTKKEKILSLFANHTSIDEIELAISTMLTYSNTSEKELFFEYSGTVKTLLHQLMEDTVPGVHSIL